MIGIFDSGIGGLNVAREIKKVFPKERVLYFGDAARYPWGNKSPELVRDYAAQISQFLISQGVRKIVIACNTASTFAGDYLRKKFPAVVFYDVITPVIERIEKEFAKNPALTVGVIGTRGTISSRIYERKIKAVSKNICVISRACPLYVTLAEEGLENHLIAKIITREYLREIKERKVDFLVLGCTHYPLLEKVIAQYLGKRTQIISSAKEITQTITSHNSPFKNNPTKNKSIYYFSDLTKHYLQLAEGVMGEKITLRKKILNQT